MKLMTTIRLTVIAALLTLGAASAVAQTNAMTAQEQANLKLVLDWWRECIEGRHLDLTPKYQSEDYIQHNINVPTGRAGFVAFFGRMGPPVNPIPAKLSSEPVVRFAKGDFVFLVWEREGKDPADASKTYKYNTYDLLRIENGKVQEHWDYALKMPGAPRGAAPVARLRTLTRDIRDSMQFLDNASMVRSTAARERIEAEMRAAAGDSRRMAVLFVVVTTVCGVTLILAAGQLMCSNRRLAGLSERLRAVASFRQQFLAQAV